MMIMQKSSVVAVILCTAALASSIPFRAAGAEPVSIDVASTFPTNMPVLGEVSRALPRKIKSVTSGTLELKFHEPGKLVPGAETVKAVSAGRIPAAWAGAGWFANVDSAFNIFSSVPFGPSFGEYLAWLYRGGGLELARQMFHTHNVHNIPCGIIPPEASGWFRKEIRSLADLKGMKMRFFGLGGRVMQRFGVDTVQLAPGDIRRALASGEIDATEFSLPAMDRGFGFHEIAKYYYFPGWHQQATLFDLYIYKPNWDAISESHKSAIELACGDAMREMIADGEALQWQAMKDMQKDGVQIKRWPPAILVAFETAWDEVVAEESRKNPSFARVYASFSQFRENYKIWRHFNQLN